MENIAASALTTAIRAPSATIRRGLCSLKLKELTPARIQAYYGKACSKLSNRHHVLSESLKYAVRQGYLAPARVSSLLEHSNP